MKTKFQETIEQYYIDSEDSFGENYSYLKQMSDIVGRKGISHNKRIEKLNYWLDWTKERSDLSYFEKSYINGLLEQSENYISKNSKRIKNSEKVLSEIENLRKKLDNNASLDFWNQEGLQEFKKDYTLDKEEDKNHNNYKIKSLFNKKRAGFAKLVPSNIFDGAKNPNQSNKIKKTIAGIVTAAVIGASAYFGGYYNANKDSEEKNFETIVSHKETLKEKQDQISNLEKIVKLKENEIRYYENKNNGYEIKLKETIESSKKQVDELVNNNKTLEKKLVLAGLPDEEVRENEIKNYKKIADNKIEKESDLLVKSYEEKIKISQNKEKTSLECIFESYEPSEETLNQDLKTNLLAESRMAILESYDEIMENKIEDTMFNTNDCTCTKKEGYSSWMINERTKVYEEKPIEKTITKVGGILTNLNQAGRWATKNTIGRIGKIFTKEKGDAAIDNANDFFWRNAPLGSNSNKDYAKIMNIASLGLLKFETKNDPYVCEDGLAGLATRIGTHYLLYEALDGGNGGSSNKPSGGFEREGGEVSGGIGRIGGEIQ